MNINVKDLGTPQKAIEMQLDICIQDYNDHAPYFVSPMNNYTIRVAEVNFWVIQIIRRKFIGIISERNRWSNDFSSVC